MSVYEKDQDTIKVLDSSGPASKRHGGVWPVTTKHLGIEPASIRLEGLTSSRQFTRAELNLAKRKEAAKWISALTGEQLPVANDNEFRAALRDGKLLCRVMNVVAPGKIKAVHDNDVIHPQQRTDNVQNFVVAALDLEVPTEYTLSMADLDCESTEDRPRVTDCILWLKRLYDGGTAVSAGTPGATGSGNGAAGEGSPGVLQPHPSTSPNQRAHSAIMKALGAPKTGFSGLDLAQQSLSNLHKVMNKETVNAMEMMSQTLKEKMAYTAGTGADSRSGSSTGAYSSRQASMYGHHSIEAMGPVLETVLANLTTEYERRLTAKDTEVTAVKDKLRNVQGEMDKLQEGMAALAVELQNSQDQARRAAAAASTAALQAAQERVQQLEQDLLVHEHERTALQAALEAANLGVDETVHQLQMQLDDKEAQLSQMNQVSDNYRKIQEECRQLYNTVQDLRGAIRVFCRIRPPGRTGDPSPSCVAVGSEQELGICDPRAATDPRLQPKPFKFDRVFADNTTQEEIYADTQPLIRSVLDGYNVTIFAYGQTGSGKTHTMTGTDMFEPEGRGINYRALDDLFALRNARSNEVTYDIKVQMLEIYNETLRDLLVENASAASNKLEILNTQASGCNVPGSNKIPVNDTEDVISMMTLGARNRHSAETKMNARSSRSHQVLTVIVDGHSRVTGVRSHGCLNLIDLAGSERTNKSEATGDRLVEANHINTSLSALGSVMAALASKNRSHVPYRDSKLTQLLADSLASNGNAKVMMFMHISPESSSYQETLSTLKFAERVASITLGEAKKHVESGEVLKAQEETMRLKHTLEDKLSTIRACEQELAHRDALLSQQQAHMDQMAEEIQQLRAQLRSAANVKRTSKEQDPQQQAALPQLQAHEADSELARLESELTPYHSVGALTPGSAGVDSRIPTPSQLFSPAMTISGLPPPSPFSAQHSPMQTIQEDHMGHSAAGAAASPCRMITPVSARTSGVHMGYQGGMSSSRMVTPTSRGSLSMRDGGKWGSASGGTPTSMLVPSIPTPPTATARPPSGARPPSNSHGGASNRASLDNSVTSLPLHKMHAGAARASVPSLRLTTSGQAAATPRSNTSRAGAAAGTTAPRVGTATPRGAAPAATPRGAIPAATPRGVGPAATPRLSGAGAPPIKAGPPAGSLAPKVQRSSTMPSVSARPSGMWGQAGAVNRSSAIPAVAASQDRTVPASAGGQRGGGIYTSGGKRWN